ncbi:unnamed protein product [Effrenium voratum]|nr:unnamed protein product [Effrenium voratum]|mmetsp:Transcript_50801/g.121434  ORF Transcript_50801/g.121434 Transcript_50801/m.121434 type:complete len:1019 (+) Transcript_50801:92-3148(+)
METDPTRHDKRVSLKSKSSKASRKSVLSLKRKGSQITLQVRRRADRSQPLTAQRLPEIINEIGMGWYHLLTFIMLVFTPLAEGAGMIVMTNITHALKHEFHLTDWQAGSLDAFSFTGLALGHYVAGFVADLKGRRLPMVLGYLGISLCSLFMTMASGYKSMVLLRVLHGFSCGLGVPPAMSMIAEIMPADWRPFMFITFWSFTAVGETYACSGLVAFMPNLQESCWKQAVMWSAAPAFIMLLLSVARLQESAHWLAVRGRLVEARVVLEQMARLNGNLETLKKLGPAPMHDLSMLYNVAGITARQTSGQTSDEHGHASPGEIFRILVQPDLLKMVALFSILASVGNIATFGMSNIWPELLRESSHSAHAAHADSEESAHGLGPAEKLTLIVSVGVPVGVVAALLSLSKAASHRAFIVLSGLAGCIGVSGVILCQHMPALLLTSMLVTHMSGTLGYSVAMIFCEESFPTDIRASATGIVIFWGTLWAVASPLLLTAVGQGGFLVIAGAAFGVASLAALPLQETRGGELKDFAEEAAVEAEEAEEYDSDSDDESDAEVEHAQLSWAFANGTLGAAIELSLLSGLLGAVPGVSFTSFYCSMGFIIDRCKDRSFFAKEMLVGNCVAVAMLVIMPRLGPWMDRKLQIHKSMFVRLVVSAFMLAVVDLMMAFPEDEFSMLTLGCIQAFLNVMMLNTSLSLASKLRSGRGRSWVQLGFVSGGLVPVVLVPFTNFGPRSGLGQRLAFYAAPAAFCGLAGLLFWAYHRQVELMGNANTGRGNMAELARAYRDFGNEGQVAQAQVAQARNPSWSQQARVAFPVVLGYQMASYFFAGLFPILDDAAIAFEMYLYMICGDMLGSFVAFVWTSSVDLSLKADITFVSLVLLSLTSTATALIPSIATISEASQQPHALQRLPSLNDSVATLVFSTFFFGSFSKAGLEAFCPKVMRARLVGVLLGLLGVLLCYLTMLSSLNAPPKLVHTQSGPLATVAAELRQAQNLQSARRVRLSHSVEITHAGVLRREIGR